VEASEKTQQVEAKFIRNVLGLHRCGGHDCATSSFFGELWRGGGQIISG
jgi:hypothetical protein